MPYLKFIGSRGSRQGGRSEDEFKDNSNSNGNLEPPNRLESVESYTFPSAVDPLKLQTSSEETNPDAAAYRKRDLNLLVKTVNNLTRMHEALEFLDDGTRRIDEKQIAVMTQNSHGVTALFWAVRRNADFRLIEKMVNIGGKQLVMLVNKSSENVLHQGSFLGISYEVFKLIVNAGGSEILTQRDRMGNTPLHYGASAFRKRSFGLLRK